MTFLAVVLPDGYHMIRTVAHKGLERFFTKGVVRGIHPSHARRLRLILARLHGATVIGDMGFPGSELHPLAGELRGNWAVKVSGNRRIVFRVEDGDAYDVDTMDYH